MPAISPAERASSVRSILHESVGALVAMVGVVVGAEVGAADGTPKSVHPQMGQLFAVATKHGQTFSILAEPSVVITEAIVGEAAWPVLVIAPVVVDADERIPVPIPKKGRAPSVATVKA